VPINQPPPGYITITGASPLTGLVGWGVLAIVGTTTLTVFFGRTYLPIVLFCVVVGLVIGLGVFRRSILAMTRWKAATLTLPIGPHPLGSQLDITYRRLPRSTRDLPEANVQITIVCEERATYRRGTETHTDVRRVVEKELGAIGRGTVRGLEATTTITVPVKSGGPTVRLSNNEVRWYLDIVMIGPGLPNDRQRFPFVVAPTLDPAMINELGDR
jgi:hypothetical protein